MQWTAFFILGCCLHVSATVKSQAVTYEGKNVPLKEVIQSVKKQTGVLFLFNEEKLDLGSKVSVSAKQMPLEDFLSVIFKNQPIRFYLEGGAIVLEAKTESKNPSLFETSPPITVKGSVVNEKGEPVAASVVIKGTKRGVVTDSYGNFVLGNVDEKATLIISAVGYEMRELKATGEISIQLRISDNKLDEVVYKGYYSTSRKLNTGAVATVGSKEIQTQPVTNPLVAIAGRMSGVNIQQTSGMPGSAMKIAIRGQNSIRNDDLDNGNLPLYVIDGVPFPSQIISSTFANFSNQSGGSPLSLINPADIERIDILKDADATAPYGSRGANGVVLITTKKGKSGKMTVNVNAFTGSGQVSKKIDLLNTEQYREMQIETAINNGWGPLLDDPANDIYFPDIKLYDSTRYTDWQDFYLGGTARFSNIQAGISGGSENVQYLFNSTFSKENAIYFKDKYSKKGLFNLNLGFSNTNKKFKANISLIYGIDNSNLPLFDPTPLIYTAPNAPAAFIDGKINWDPRYLTFNPAAIVERRYEGSSNNLVANTTMSYDLLKGLAIRMQAGYNKLEQQLNTFNPLTSFDPSTVSFGRNSFNVINVQTYNLQPEMEYSNHIGGGDFSVLVSSTFQESINQQTGINGQRYTSDLYLENISLAPRTSIVPPVYNQYKYNGFLGKITYNWQNKYIVNLIGRRDGSSRFGADRQFGNFGSAGAAWIFSNESFFKQSSFFSFGKLRGSYGTTGSDQIGDYGYLGTYQGAPYPYDNAVGLTPVRIANPLYSWEVSKKMDVALELGMINDRVFLSAGYYHNRTSKQLVGYPLPPSAGSPTGNVQANSPATVQNTGVELDITSKNIKEKNFTWTTIINFTVPRNKLVAYPGIERSAYASRLVVGQPLSIANVYEFTGVDSQTGLYTVKDQNGDGIYNAEDYVPFFKGQKLFGGILNSFSYHNFQLDFHFQFVRQSTNDVFQQMQIPVTTNYNFPVEVLDRWQKPGDNARFQKPGSAGDMGTTYYRYLQSNATITDASYIRLKNLSISYSLPSRLTTPMHAQQIRAYVQGQNLLTITNYTGLDPEAANPQVLPTLRMIVFGLQCVF